MSEHEEESQESENQDNQGTRPVGGERRGIPPVWLIAFAAFAAAAVGLGYYLIKIAPEYIQTVESRECLSCHAEFTRSLKRKSVHFPFNARRCTACHTSHGLELIERVTVTQRLFGLKWGSVKKAGQLAHGEVKKSDEAPRPSKKSRLRAPVSKLCGETCHANLVAVGKSKKYQMPPFAKKQCTSCHQPHASNQDFLLSAPIKPLCLSCHRQIAKYVYSENKHPPFVAGSCTSCHRPHASNVKPLLRRRPKTLCLSCHPTIAKLMKLPVKMEPFETGNCPKCHNPHGSGNAKLLKDPVPFLCFKCHQGIAELRKKPVQMPPFRQGLCLGCHRPHASENPKLLQAALEKNEICFKCHGALKANYQPIGHNRVVNNASRYQPEGGVGSCLNCHEPHGSDYKGLVQTEIISLCLKCHGPRRYFAHPLGIKFEDPWRGGYLRCTSCHNPMGSGNVRLKHRDKDGLCLSCHDSSDPSYIYFQNGPWHRYQVRDSQ